jgi:hypothetical protein
MGEKGQQSTATESAAFGVSDGRDHGVWGGAPDLSCHGGGVRRRRLEGEAAAVLPWPDLGPSGLRAVGCRSSGGGNEVGGRRPAAEIAPDSPRLGDAGG